MFPPDVAETFERDHGCTDTEWRRWLPEAVGRHGLEQPVAGQARVKIDGGELQLQWVALPPRRIALLHMPRLQVRYRFSGVSAESRKVFMRLFDLTMQRGGG